MIDCPHEFHESEAAVATEGLCPLCLAADVNRLMIENERLRAVLKEIVDVEPEYAHDWGWRLREIAWKAFVSKP